jgi:N-acetylglutamate synthase-like GNAT family acetyltransferase
MHIKYTETNNEKNDLSELLWDILWKPLGLPRNIGSSYKLNNPQIELIAIEDGVIIGGLVANRLSANLIEIRHIAVKPEFQNTSIGKELVTKLITSVEQSLVIKIQVFARNTSVDFFTKLNFTPINEYLEHPDFSAHGIRFQQMYIEIPIINS